MINSFEQRHAPGRRLCPAFGGGSSSTTAATTNNTDMRVVGGDDSVNLSAQNSTVSVIATDHGAVSAGLDLSSKAIDASTKTASASLEAGTNMFEGALSAVSSANDKLALAYQSGQAPEQTMLKYAGFAVVGLAAVMLFKKG
jgi:hypothetical protein